METERQIAAAKEAVHRLQGRISKPHHRLHSNAASDNVNRLRALEGLCGECVNLELKFARRDGKDVVILGCSQGYSPVALYGNTPLGEEASCDGYEKRVLK